MVLILHPKVPIPWALPFLKKPIPAQDLSNFALSTLWVPLTLFDQHLKILSPLPLGLRLDIVFMPKT
jgi:hypothetical protein